jgi:ankyrin repeat protein
MMPLYYACQRGHVEAVKAFVEMKININMGSGPSRLTPLGYAAAHNHYELCEYLLSNKARVLGKDKFKRTPLTMAARNGNAKVLSLLLKNGAVWDDPDSSGNTPLHYATAYGWKECAEILINAGANVNANSSWKITPLNIAMLKNHFGVVKFLLNQPGIDVNCKDEQGRTLISLAVELNTDEAIEYMTYLLKEKGADPNVPDINGDTPLHHLASK